MDESNYNECHRKIFNYFEDINGIKYSSISTKYTVYIRFFGKEIGQNLDHFLAYNK